MSAQKWLLREANVKLSTKDATNGGQGIVKTVRTTIWYKRACIIKTRDDFLLARSNPTSGAQQAEGLHPPSSCAPPLSAVHHTDIFPPFPDFSREIDSSMVRLQPHKQGDI